MKMELSFPGNARVHAHFKGHTLATDQPEKAGGEDSAPAPFDVFLASIATCTGYYALHFCEQREIATEGLGVSLEVFRDEERKRVGKIRMEIRLPQGFPEKYRQAIVRAADQCAVKRHVMEPPEFEIVAV
ncbi:MAG TPA: OsmC family protein [Thermoanaerobaculia bacterium]